jgi:hypothetical protein
MSVEIPRNPDFIIITPHVSFLYSLNLYRYSNARYANTHSNIKEAKYRTRVPRQKILKKIKLSIVYTTLEKYSSFRFSSWRAKMITEYSIILR